MKVFTLGVSNNFQVISLLCMLATCLSLPADADPRPKASLLKAIYTYKFANFTRWPVTQSKHRESSINLCIIGTPPFSASELAEIAGKEVKQRPLKIINYPSGVIASAAMEACHIAFISTSEEKRLPALLRTLQAHPVLTVSDIETFADSGGMITLLSHNDRITFEVNVAQIRQAQLMLSSKVLEFSRIIQHAKIED